MFKVPQNATHTEQVQEVQQAAVGRAHQVLEAVHPQVKWIRPNYAVHWILIHVDPHFGRPPPDPWGRCGSERTVGGKKLK